MWRKILLFLAFSCLAYARTRTTPTLLTEDKWHDLLQGEWLVKFYAPWCPACKALVETWEAVASWSEDLNIKVATIDVTENPGLSGRFLVTSLPTIYHVKDGEFRQYRGPRGENDIVSFVDDALWKDIEPVPWYSAPTSFHMGAIGMFFKLSIGIRDLHNQMTTDYGIPVWGSYCIFAVVTIFAGLLLGLLIVYLCDAMFPPSLPPVYNNQRHQMPPRPGQETMGDESDIVDDDLDDTKEEEKKEEEKKEEESKSSGGDVRPSTARKRVARAD
ncbi:hypothetical protein CAPTEDRAFT_173899 [Capitella teleta]|uniref:Thioredoxin domain-containing protein n=1 Tax=Capitella teleta TaxID=283909 RepID=R7V929_CAPTE|nr:hypothetical protein CAPTEDRAFT_173899 [Capitella teleta]|eukprot:ELU12866.1 hypothetical protein CAPTEDRAFT_173899 [Capitella teleta]